MQEKDGAVRGQDFEKAGQLRDQEMELKAKIQAIMAGEWVGRQRQRQGEGRGRSGDEEGSGQEEGVGRMPQTHASLCHALCL